ncbi:hypothetical protein PAECIP111893_03335 [Paenibacillus plantiphilus]|uniref:asparagine synthase (glutamine-hydrolyzing) n=1 Tax=Paenibacillus plantiphilus TaxID=2905650 RepID=A0ABN8GK18_9BACL|nr:asparagine synthase-related protein [Paenibacillus plantiphilus]CAH1210948.1 hypothetical protein PAECIP111893_03335 [Paenibacillus plantiphilus]
MSAIAGIYYSNGMNVEIEEYGQLMQGLQRYHADAVHTWHDRSVFLGCHAQWITPESRNEVLPYYDALNKLAITADVILDNRDDLFHRLQVDPSRRSGMTDSELLLLAYRKWGQDAPNYLIGDYAFIIWDEERQLLFGARDLFGNRTLYYHQSWHRLAFCTTIMPLLSLPGVKKELNEMWLASFMAIPVMVESGDIESTVYKGICQIPPAHSFTAAAGKLTLSKYGSIIPAQPLRLKSNEEYEEAFRAVFQEAVQSGLRTDRQVGVFLSGGLDSGSVASFAARTLQSQGKKLNSYSYVPVNQFVDWTNRHVVADESPYIKATAQYAGNINDHYMDCPDRSPLSVVDDWLDLLEMPYKFFENSFWIKGINEQAERDGVGMLLTGARGNQTISWGSAVQYYAVLLKKLRWVQFYREVQSFSRGMGIGRSRLLSLICKQAMPFMPQASLLRGEPDVPRMIHPEFARKTNVMELLQEQDAELSGFLRSNPVEARVSQLQSLVIANLRGTKGTKLSLQHRLWERDVTCDPRVVRFCLSVPLEQYVQQGVDRSLIRRATKGYLPDMVRLNQRIRGIQGADWVHRILPAWPAIVDELQQLRRDDSVNEMIDVNRIEAALADIGEVPTPDSAFSPQIRFLMRSLILYRFLKQF